MFFIACSAEKSSGEHSLVLINKMELLDGTVGNRRTINIHSLLHK